MLSFVETQLQFSLIIQNIISFFCIAQSTKDLVGLSAYNFFGFYFVNIGLGVGVVFKNVTSKVTQEEFLTLSREAKE